MSDAEDSNIGSGEEAGEEAENQETEPQIVGVPLTKEIIAKCLSRLERISDGTSFAYVKIDAPNQEINNLEILNEYPHIRYLNLSANRLTELAPIATLKYLLYLQCDRNILEKIDLPLMEYLQIVDFSFNKIHSFEGLEHPLLKILNLNSNTLTNLTISENQFKNLEVLELRSNAIESLEGFSVLMSLKKLYISQNKINNLVPISGLKSLETLHARQNELASLAGLDELENLVQVNFRENLLVEINELDHLANNKRLLKFSCLGNPLAEEDVRVQVLLKLGSLIRINKLEVSEEELQEVQDLRESQNEEAED